MTPDDVSHRTIVSYLGPTLRSIFLLFGYCIIGNRFPFHCQPFWPSARATEIYKLRSQRRRRETMLFTMLLISSDSDLWIDLCAFKLFWFYLRRLIWAFGFAELIVMKVIMLRLHVLCRWPFNGYLKSLLLLPNYLFSIYLIINVLVDMHLVLNN